MKNQEIYDQIIKETYGYNIFFRSHNQAGITLEQMQEWKSYHGVEWNEETEEDEDLWLDGVACSDTLGETGFGGAGIGIEIVVFRGQRVEDIYDGVVVFPTKIIYRFTEQEYNDFLSYVEMQ